MKRAACLLAMAVWAMGAVSQHRLEGVISGPEGDPLPGANVVLKELNRGTVSGDGGSFLFRNVESGTHTLVISYVGFRTLQKEIRVAGDTDLGPVPLEPSPYTVEEVIVTGTRAGEDSPVAHTEIEREEITARNFGQDVPYLLSMTPSLVTSSDAGHGIGYTSMRIRGTDANRINVTINGIPLNDAESHSVFWVDLPDLATSVENIQIQRGVGTSTNGAAAFGASVNLMTLRSGSEPYGRYEGSFGSYGTYRNSVSAGTGLLGGRFSVDLRLSDMHSDGYMDRSRADLSSYYASAGYRDGKTLLKLVTFSGREELSQAWSGVPSDILEVDRTYNGLGYMGDDSLGNPRYYDNQVDHYRQDHYQLHFSRELGPGLFANAALHYTRGLGYYEEYKPGESLAAYLLDPVIVGGDTIHETDLIRRKWLDNHFFGAVGGLQFSEERTEWVLGGGWNRYIGDHYGSVIWARFPGDSEIRHRWYESTGRKSDWNSYLKGTFRAGDRLSLFADLQLRGIGYRIEGTDDDLRDITQEHDYLFFNPKGGLNFQLDPGQRVYLYVARASREPNRSNFIDADPAGPVPSKETLLDYEAGYSYRGTRFTAGVNLYWMDYTDQLVLTGEINDVGSPVMTNVESSYRAGIELQAGAQITSWLRWDANATLSRNKIRGYVGYVDNWDYWSDPENEPYQVRENLGTTDLAFSPPVIANSRIGLTPIPDLRFDLMTRYVDRQFIDNTSSPGRSLDPYWVQDLQVSYAFRPGFLREISVNLQVINLFDMEYETFAWVYRYVLNGNEAVFDGYFPQAGIHFMAGVRLSF